MNKKLGCLILILVFLFSSISVYSETNKNRVSKRLPVVLYHSIIDKPFGIETLHVRVKEFDTQMKYFHDNGYTTLYFSEIKEAYKYKKPVIITFDDGYEDNWKNAYPILKKYKLKATIFLITSAVGKKNYLTADEISNMKDIISFQSHTVTHKMLSKIPVSEAKEEINQSYLDIEKLTGKKPDALCYPVGKFNSAVEALVKKKYSYATTTKEAMFYSNGNQFRISRLYIGRGYTMKRFTGKLNER